MRNVQHILAALLLLPAAAFAAPVWTSNFESGDLSNWSKVQSVSSDRVTFATDPVREGSKSLKVTVRQGDDPVNCGNDRAELVYLTHEAAGSEYYYRWSVMFPADYPSSPKWQLFTQWHQDGLAGSPPVEIYLVGDEFRLRTGGNEGPVLWTAPLQRGVWNDFILHVKWSSDPNVGSIELFHNGKVALPETKAQTQLPGQLNYLKMGLYRAREISQEASIYFDDIRMGTTMADVVDAPAQEQQQPDQQTVAENGGGEATNPPDQGSGGGWTSGNVVLDPTTDPDGPVEDGDVKPEDLAGRGCTAGGNAATPLAAAIALLGGSALLRRRRRAEVTVPARRK